MVEVVASSLSLGEIFSIAVDLGKIRLFFPLDLFSSNCFLGRRQLFECSILYKKMLKQIIAKAQ